MTHNSLQNLLAKQPSHHHKELQLPTVIRPPTASAPTNSVVHALGILSTCCLSWSKAQRQTTLSVAEQFWHQRVSLAALPPTSFLRHIALWHAKPPLWAPRHTPQERADGQGAAAKHVSQHKVCGCGTLHRLNSNMVQAAVPPPQALAQAGHALVTGRVGRKVQEVHLATEGRHDARQQRLGERARIACMHRSQLPQGRSKAERTTVDRQRQSDSPVCLTIVAECG